MLPIQFIIFNMTLIVWQKKKVLPQNLFLLNPFFKEVEGK